MSQTSAAQTVQTPKMRQLPHQYKPKTAFVHRDEIIEPGEFYFLEVGSYLFRGRIRPGQTLTMRKGCLADIGDIVQLAHDDPAVCRVELYQAGMEYTAVCVSIITPTELARNDCKKLPKERYRATYTLNNIERYTPWFGSISRACDAMDILNKKYECIASLCYGREER